MAHVPSELLLLRMETRRESVGASCNVCSCARRLRNPGHRIRHGVNEGYLAYFSVNKHCFSGMLSVVPLWPAWEGINNAIFII
jgi:hypothetical protein